MTRDEAVLFLMGKMDCLRYASLLMDHGQERFCYPRQQIEELLKDRYTVMEAFGVVPSSDSTVPEKG